MIRANVPDIAALVADMLVLSTAPVDIDGAGDRDDADLPHVSGTVADGDIVRVFLSNGQAFRVTVTEEPRT